MIWLLPTRGHRSSTNTVSILAHLFASFHLSPSQRSFYRGWQEAQIFRLAFCREGFRRLFSSRDPSDGRSLRRPKPHQPLHTIHLSADKTKYSITAQNNRCTFKCWWRSFQMFSKETTTKSDTAAQNLTLVIFGFLLNYILCCICFKILFTGSKYFVSNWSYTHLIRTSENNRIKSLFWYLVSS